VASGVQTIPLAGTVAPAGQPPKTSPLRLGAFLTGPENSLVAAALAPYLQRAATTYSPLVLYGPHGSGKTHLSLGLADWWRSRFADAPVGTFTGSEFARALSEANEAGQLEEWREQVRGYELFVLEDLGELSSKAAAQRELSLTLDALAQRESLVVITARSLPTHWTTLQAALRSRLSAGLVVPLAYPTRSTRRAILEQLAAARNLPLPRRMLDGLADGLSGGVPTLVSAILELELLARSDGKPLDAERMRDLVASRDTGSETTVRVIASVTARYFGLKVSDLKSAQRRRALVAGRSVAMYLSRQLTSRSLGEIGKFFGGRDHTTVLYGCRRVEKLLRRDRALRQAVAELKQALAAS